MLNETLSDLNSVKSNRVVLNQTLKSIIQQILVKKFLQGNERPCDKNDFLDAKDNLEKFTADIKQLVENLVSDHFSNINSELSENSHQHIVIDNEVLALLLILCGQNSSFQPWNTEATLINCKIIFSQILILLKCRNSFELISRSGRVNLIKNILQKLCTDLTASTWKHFPASVVCYRWVLEMIRQPYLSQYLELVLPPALLLTDDFVTENKIIGVQCLNHIIQNVTIAELQLYRHGEVIYSALIPSLRTREVDLIQFAVIPLVSLTAKLDFDLGKKNPTKWSKFDTILEIYLENMELEQRTDLRNCYILNLSVLISNAGCNVIRWSKRLMRIFSEYIETAGKYSDETTTHHCVKAIEKFIELSKEATFLHAKQLFFTLQIALYSASSSTSDTQNESLKIATKCIKKLLELFTETEKEELKRDFINNFSGDLKCKTFYNQMFDLLKNK